MLTRRQTITLLGSGALMAASGSLPGCAARADIAPGQGRLLNGPDKTPVSLASGMFEGRPFTLDSPFRVASISKVLVAELARRLHGSGQLDMDADAGPLMAHPLRHPDYPDAPITLRQLVSHQSGIIDPPVYWMAAPGNIRDLLGPDMWEAGVRPGAGFRYSNLNYGLAATVMEAATGRRFDHLFTEWIAVPHGLDIGFNWSGVSAAKRANGFPCLRGSGKDWRVQVDGTETLQNDRPAILMEPDWSLSEYVPGTNGTLFSPQGGLRASVNDLAVIGREILLTQPDLWTPRWRASDTQGRGSESEVIEGRGSESGHFIAFGEGVYLYPDGPGSNPDDTLWVGHHGEAYGFYGGLWVMPETQEVFVHADLGSPEGGSPLLGGTPNQTEIATHAFAWAQARRQSAS